MVGRVSGMDEGFLGALPVLAQSLDLAPLTADHQVNAWGTFCPGVLGMARSDAPGSGNSQFFLMRAAQANLDQKYTPFGRVIAGLDVVRAIKTRRAAAPADGHHDKGARPRRHARQRTARRAGHRSGGTVVQGGGDASAPRPTSIRSSAIWICPRK